MCASDRHYTQVTYKVEHFPSQWSCYVLHNCLGFSNDFKSDSLLQGIGWVDGGLLSQCSDVLKRHLGSLPSQNCYRLAVENSSCQKCGHPMGNPPKNCLTSRKQRISGAAQDSIAVMKRPSFSDSHHVCEDG